jgi:Sec-independent protein translocase protein TatA
MVQAPTSSYLAVMLVLLSLAAFCVTGPHEIAAAAQAHGGIVGEFFGGLKQEDDEAEARENREHAPQTREERKEANEEAEAASMQASQTGEGEEG